MRKISNRSGAVFAEYALAMVLFVIVIGAAVAVLSTAAGQRADASISSVKTSSPLPKETPMPDDGL